MSSSQIDMDVITLFRADDLKFAIGREANTSNSLKVKTEAKMGLAQ